MLLSATAIPLNAYEENGVSPLAENAYNLNVTYTPADTTYQQTTYTIAFKNPSSTWATGKTVTDYATVISTGDTTATLTVLQPFSEQIIVTASNNYDTSIKATTTVDYLYSSLSCDMISYELNDWTEELEFSFFDLGEGSILPEYSNAITFHFSHTLSDEFCSLMSSKGYPLSDNYSITFNYWDGSYPSLFSPQIILLLLGGLDDMSFIESEFLEAFCSSMTEIQEYNTMVKNKESLGLVKLESVHFHRVLNGVNYGDLVSPIGKIIYFNDNSPFVIPATSISTNTSSIIAG